MNHNDYFTLIFLDALVVVSLDDVVGSPKVYPKVIGTCPLIQVVVIRGRDVRILTKLRITFVSIMRS